ncbi:MAG: FtsX-like permease family protein [Deltaproteobacteria bacterium]|jgi:putative ABC transport system permease protein|nr:FtsX-like permease family protein [Deltaproteobacteria bacterium]
MNIFRIPLRYMLAKWPRTLLLLCIFLLGVAAMAALQEVSSIVNLGFEKKLIAYGANILVFPHRETLKVSYGGYTLGDVTLKEQSLRLAETMTAIDGIQLRANLAVIAPKLLSTVEINGQNVGLVGVIWDEESAIKTYWEVRGELPQADGVLIGAVASSRLNLEPGDRVNIKGAELPISGVLEETGSDDDNVIFLPLALMQALTGRVGEADFLEVAALCSGCPIEDIVEELRTALPGQDVQALRQVAESRMYAVHFAQNLTFYISLLILITACATVFMAMLSAVNERRKEIGIMRSVGFSRMNIFCLFSMEALLVGVLAGALGSLLGHQLAAYVLQTLHLAEPLSDAPMFTESFSLLTLFLTAAFVGMLAVLAAFFPAWKASRVEPTEALVLL